MNLYYDIAGHSICIKCANNLVMEALEGFRLFQTEECDTAEVYIILNEGDPQSIYGQSYYSITTSIATCFFYKDNEQLGLEIKQDNVLKLSLRRSLELGIYYIQGDMQPALLNYALWFAFNTAFVESKTIAIHASAIILKKKAWLYTGESGTGKSTHTRLINKYFDGVELLNDDSPILRIQDGKCIVYGSPWSGKTQCYKQQCAELGAIVRLRQASANKITLLSLQGAIVTLLPSFPPELYLCMDWQPNVIEVISEIIEQKHIGLLECLPNKEAAILSIETMTNIE